jgi:hypothetical protein
MIWAALDGTDSILLLLQKYGFIPQKDASVNPNFLCLWLPEAFDDSEGREATDEI